MAIKKKVKKSIEYTDVSWNPSTGCLAQNCAVRERNACWAERMAKRQAGRNGYDKEKYNCFREHYQLPDGLFEFKEINCNGDLKC